jgi:hypothetical protein
MMTMIFHAHSGLRYLVLLAALAALIAAIAGWRRSAAGGPERVLMMSFVGLVDLQVVLGLVLLALWPFYGALVGHIVMMVVAAIVAHAGALLARRREPGRSGSPVRAATVVVTLLLIVGGIMSIGRSVV